MQYWHAALYVVSVCLALILAGCVLRREASECSDLGEPPLSAHATKQMAASISNPALTPTPALQGVSVCLSACTSAWVSACLSVCQLACTSFSLSVSVFVSLSVKLSVCLFVCRFISLSVCQPSCMSFNLSVCQLSARVSFACLPVCQSACLSACLTLCRSVSLCFITCPLIRLFLVFCFLGLAVHSVSL